CEVPAWIRVLSPTRPLESTRPPPIPTQVAELSACLDTRWVAVGTTQSPETWWNRVPFFSSVPWLYPDQLFDWLAPTAISGRWCSCRALAVRAGAIATARIAPRAAPAKQIRSVLERRAACVIGEVPPRQDCPFDSLRRQRPPRSC